MTKHLTWVLLVLVAAAACSRNSASSESEPLAASDAAAVEQGVRSFMADVATDVTQQGPLAWSKYFDSSPAFFMAVNGQVAFPNGAAAQDGVQKVALALKHIDLKWGDLRIDPLTRDLAFVAAPWHEIQTDAAGHTVEESGFFTALAEYQSGRWRFRNLHWSSPVSPSSAH